MQIAILDFGSQYTHLIARRVRQLGVRADIFPPTVDLKQLTGVRGVILSGGPQSVHDATAIDYNPKVLDLSVPILGLCYGHQLLVQHFGGEVKPGKTKEYGFAKVKNVGASALFAGITKTQQVWMSHGDAAKVLPKGFATIGATSDCPIAAVEDSARKRYGLQFHPEVAHSTHGIQILQNFVFGICGAKKDWSTKQFWNEIVADVKTIVGKRNVFLLVSGGVDSTVCFAILQKILGKKRVYGLHIDNGFMRQDETKEVAAALRRAGFADLQVIDASQQFLAAVVGVVEPEEKRKRIGRTFLQVKDEVMAQLKLNPKDWVLGQGTIYPDTIETGGTKHADTIKTHHNRVDEIIELMKRNGVVEPLKHLYKDEVRALGLELKLPKALLERHPFPGPGLSIRTLCSAGDEQIDQRAKVDAALQKRMPKSLTSRVLPVKSVGVQGDNRTYRHPAVIMGSATWKQLGELSVRITNEVHAVNRVVYLISPKKVDVRRLTTKPAHLTKHRLDLLRQADAIVMDEVRRAGQYHDIWQFPVILAPLTLHGGETIVLRPVQSQEAMTVNFYPMPKTLLNAIIKRLQKLSGVDLVLYDITNKPPGTIEWE
jgi:GMP synthase (glutamine-hydrolysing)